MFPLRLISYIGAMADNESIVFLDRATLGPGVQLRAPAFSHQWHEYDASTTEEAAARARTASIVITNKVPITRDLLRQTSALKLVAVAATGTDMVDLGACKAQGVAVCNVRDYATTSVPEHILALLLSLRRRLPAYQRRVREGDWQRSRQFCFFDRPIMDLAGSTLGIIGTGSIARALGTLAGALGINVLHHSLSGRDLPDLSVVSLDELLIRADVVSLNCPLTDASRNLINRQTLRQMKPEALLINTARGALVDTQALETALVTGEIGGAGIDVSAQEPPPVDDPLMRLCHLDNVLVTPHSAWASEASMQALADQLITAIEAFVAGLEMNRVA